MGILNTNFTPFAKGKQGVDWVIKALPIIASVAMDAGSMLYYVGDGTCTVVTTTSANPAGILLAPIAATDADYATSGKLKYVAVPVTSLAEFEFTVGSGTLTAEDVGTNADFASATTIAVDTDSHHHVRITAALSATRGRAVLNPDIA